VDRIVVSFCMYKYTENDKKESHPRVAFSSLK